MMIVLGRVNGEPEASKQVKESVCFLGRSSLRIFLRVTLDSGLEMDSHLSKHTHSPKCTRSVLCMIIICHDDVVRRQTPHPTTPLGSGHGRADPFHGHFSIIRE